VKKPRSDCKLAGLTDEQREALAQWLLSGMGYETARVRVRSEFGIQTSVAALSGFWNSEVAPRVLMRRTRAAQAADVLVDQASVDNPKIDAALRSTLKQRAFEILIDPSSDPGAIAAVVNQAMTLGRLEAAEAERSLKREALDLQREQRDRDLEIKERAIAVVEEKLAMAKEQLERVRAAVTEAKSAGGLTPEALAKIEEAAKLL
jgi:hypothetical protein